MMPNPPGGTPPVDMYANVIELRKQLAEVIAESRAFRAEVDEAQQAQVALDLKRDAQRKRENTLMGAGALAMMIPLLLMLFVAIQGSRTAGVAARSAAEAKKTSDQIASCTTPEGKCYQDAGKRTSGAVLNIIRGNIVIAECRQQRSPDTSPAAQRELEACISAGLKRIGIDLPPMATP